VKPLRDKIRPTTAQMLAARPLRLSADPPTEHGPGQWRITVPLRPARWASRLLRGGGTTRNLTKTFELDELGKLVWDACDGKISVKQIIRQLAARYHLNEREAQVATVAFLRTLMRKGLIGISAKDA
jgi:hypothetical protein